MMNEANIRFEYLYRDAANYKNWGEVVFSNPSGLPVDEVLERLRTTLIDRSYFVAAEAQIPDLHFPQTDLDIDHDWHEFHSVIDTSETPNDTQNRRIETFLDDLQQACEEKRFFLEH